MNNRRKLIVALGASALVVPFGSIAQQQGKVWRIGYLSLLSRPSIRDENFREGLRDLGYVVDSNITIEYRWAGGNRERLQELAAELVGLKVDVIVTASSPVAEAAKRATRTIPIVMAAIGDAVGSGLIDSLARPGGNITGLTMMSTDLANKRVQLVRELLPKATRIAVLVLANATASQNMLEEMRPVAKQMGIQLVLQTLNDGGSLPGIFSAIQRERAQALIVQTNPISFDYRARIAELAVRQRLPTIYEGSEFVAAGGFLSYGPSVNDMYRRSATYIDKIFKGAKPADLPIEQPTKFELVVNLKIAKALGLKVSQSILVRADKVIE
jgi:putative ABC transport system substrate-binding protein